MSASVVQDPISLALADRSRGWKVIDGTRITRDYNIECDVVIVGSGAGGGTAAEALTLAGLNVVMIEEGPFKSSSDFRMRERDAYPQLYQESAGRQTKDKSITILQGRSVGGSTTVNWTSSFRTPPATLQHWEKVWGLDDYTVAKMAPWFEKMEARLSISPWPVPPNENNDILRRGCEKLGIPAAAIRRNVKGCWNLGYCGMGCPTNAKQSMLVTTIPDSLDRGLSLIHSTRVEKLSHRYGRVTSLIASGMSADAVGVNTAAGPWKIRVHARHFILAGGAINNPALMLRSQFPDPHHTLGKRTFLHPSPICAAIMDRKVEAYSGAPQSIYSDHFVDSLPHSGPMGFKLEAPPLHPVLAGITLPGFGDEHATWMKRIENMHVAIALMRDGFHPQSKGGQVSIRNDGSPILDYVISGYVWDGIRHALSVMAEIQFAAGAKIVMPMHEDAKPYRSWADAKLAIESLPMAALRTRVASAHVMGGCTMGNDARVSVTRGDGRHHQLENLWVFDGSVFPTSIGANPQLTIYGTVARNASRLADQIKKPEARFA
ncbi:MAG: GMC family oxidoreductase [Betaproteobacteria bacterium]|nr:GMC family oxidoreductase [Betaproteobacteria bacterium]